MFWNRKQDHTHLQTALKESYLIDLRGISKSYHTDAGDFVALKNLNLQIGQGEFVSIVGKSGSGKTTLINMLAGIDRPTQGEIYVAGTAVHHLNESDMATWRGLNVGVVFQFFQLLPTLTVLENVMLPMGLCNLYSQRERIERGQELLDLVGIGETADQLPARLSGGQQQRAAIARALANDPPIVVTDEPTGNLDSKTADRVMSLFEWLVDQGKTVLMVTHDSDLATRALRTIALSNGELLNENLAKALPTLDHELLLRATRQLQITTYAPGEPIILPSAEPDNFYVVINGEADVLLDRDGSLIQIDSLGPNQFFGEIALVNGGQRTALVRASERSSVEVATLSRNSFLEIVNASKDTLSILGQVIQQRLNRQTLADRAKI